MDSSSDSSMSQLDEQAEHLLGRSSRDHAGQSYNHNHEHGYHVQKMPVLHRRWSRLLLASLGILAIFLGLASSGSVQEMAARQGLLEYANKAAGGLFFTGHKTPYYTPSASLLPPALSTLPSSLQRITLIAIWAGNDRPDYLNNYLRSAALNADVADLLVIHLTNDQSKCLDGRDGASNDGIYRDKAWDWENGGNIRVVCLSREAELELKADYLCREDNWDCPKETRAKVLDRLHARPDPISVEWKPMRGEIYNQFFIHPENPLWAWSDMDMHLGRLDHLPFPLLSTVSIIGLHVFTPKLLFLAGQLTLFNMAAPGFVGAWKKYASLSSAEAFINPADWTQGGYPEGSIDEIFLSAAYLRGEEGYAGQGLSWMATSDTHGQDIFMPGRKFVISGRNVLEVDAELTREEIEAILYDAESEPVDEYAGWREGAQVLDTSMVEGKNCAEAWFTPEAAQCVQKHPLTVGDQYTRIDSVRRATVVRIGTEPENQLHLHLEPDRRPRRWQRKLFLHYQEIKRQTWWWHLPPWFIGDDNEVMEFDWKMQRIWRKGAEREVDIWKNDNDRIAEDGHSKHTEGVHLPGQPDVEPEAGTAANDTQPIPEAGAETIPEGERSADDAAQDLDKLALKRRHYFGSSF